MYQKVSTRAFVAFPEDEIKSQRSLRIKLFSCGFFDEA
jgi:hypothetical protein